MVCVSAFQFPINRVIDQSAASMSHTRRERANKERVFRGILRPPPGHLDPPLNTDIGGGGEESSEGINFYSVHKSPQTVDTNTREIEPGKHL